MATPTDDPPMAGPDADPPTVQQGVRPTDPPTVQQGARPGAEIHDPATVQQGPGRQGTAGAPSDPPTTRQGTADSYIPPELYAEYDVETRLGGGSEGVVWLVRSKETGDPHALKVHSPEHPLDRKLLELLANEEDFTDHAPRIHRIGTALSGATERTWVLMEYLPYGSLAKLIADEREADGGLPADRAEEVLAELAEAVHFWQTRMRRNPLDLKPSNLMLRSRRPLRLVVSDLGGVVRMTESQQYGAVVATPAYTPPEGLTQWRSRAWPWWSLGEIAYELVTGSRRFGEEWEIQHDRVFGEFDLSKIADPRWRRLIRGLLTRQPRYRWEHDEVRRWLAGEEPALHTPGPEAETEGPATPPIVFNRGDHRDAAELAAAMTDAPEQAADWLVANTQTLFDWLESGVKDNRFARHEYLRGLAGDRARAHRAVAALGAAYLPDRPPGYRGHRIDAEGLLALATEGPAEAEILRELVDGQILEIAAKHECDHDTCTGRCAVLDRVADEVPRVVTGVRQAGRPVPADDRDEATALAVWLTLSPEAGADLVKGAASVRVRGVDWWADVLAAARKADARTVPGRTAIITAVISGTQAMTAQEEELERRRTRSKAQVAPRRALDKRAVLWAAIAAVTVLGPWLLGHYWWRPNLVEVTATPPTDLRALPPGHGFVPEYVFGLLVVGGLLGLVLIRPPWKGRIASLVVGLILVAAALESPKIANAVVDKYNSAGTHAYASGPVPAKVMGQVCGDVWTSTTPVAGVSWRYTLVNGGGECTRMVAYAGWHRIWRRKIDNGSYDELAFSGGTLVVREVRQSEPNRLLAVADATGKVRWHWSCPAEENVSGVTYHGISDHSSYSSDAKYIAVECGSTTYRVTYEGHGRRA